MDDENDRNKTGGAGGRERFQRMLADGRSLSGHERNCCYLNTGGSAVGGGRFANISASSGIDFPDDGRALALSDWDHDGDLDVWISNRNAPRLRFLRNELPQSGHYLSVKLVGNGTTSNRDAIGARVELVIGERSSVSGNQSDTDHRPPTTDRRLIKSLRAGEGFLSQNTKWLHFGLGDEREVAKLTVRWPDGSTGEFHGLAVDQRYIVRQGARAVEPVAGAARQLKLSSADQVVADDLGTATLRLVTPLEMPPLLYQTFDGLDRSIEVTGKEAVLVNLWASWCAPCLKELQEMATAQKRLGSAGVTVLALSVDGVGKDGSDPVRAAEYLQSIDFPFRSGRASEELLDRLQTLHDLQTALHQPLPLPTSFLIDSSGRLLVIYKGPVTVEQLLADLAHGSDSQIERFQRSAAIAGRVLEHEVNLRALERLEAERRFNFAGWLQRYGYPARAADQYKSILKVWPDSERAHVDFAVALMGQGQLGPAEDHLKKALSINPEASASQLYLGNLYLRQRRLSLAKDHFEKAHQLSPHDMNILNNLGTVHSQLGEYQRAVDSFTQAIELKPDDSGGYNNVGWLRATCADPTFRNAEEAVTHARRACELTQWKQYKTLDTLAAAYAEAGQFDDAIRWQSKAVQMAPAMAKRSLTKRLELYRLEKPYHDTFRQ